MNSFFLSPLVDIELVSCFVLLSLLPTSLPSFLFLSFFLFFFFLEQKGSKISTATDILKEILEAFLKHFFFRNALTASYQSEAIHVYIRVCVCVYTSTRKIRVRIIIIAQCWIFPLGFTNSQFIATTWRMQPCFTIETSLVSK